MFDRPLRNHLSNWKEGGHPEESHLKMVATWGPLELARLVLMRVSKWRMVEK